MLLCTCERCFELVHKELVFDIVYLQRKIEILAVECQFEFARYLLSIFIQSWFLQLEDEFKCITDLCLVLEKFSQVVV
jgi:hypothetical protein